MKRRAEFFTLFILGGFMVFQGCKSEVTQPDKSGFQVFSLIDPAQSGLDFANNLAERPGFNIMHFDYFYNGSGVAIGDINNDGLPDVLLTANTSANRLFLNKGGLQFEDITEKAGLRQGRWSTGAVMADINNDGLLDIYICNGGPSKNPDSLKNECYINRGGGVFEEVAQAYGIDGAHRSSQASFFDYDQDGDLDLFVMNYADLVFRTHDNDKNVSQYYPEEKFPLNSCVLYRNEGNGRFDDVSREAGILKPAFGLGLTTSDMNGDGLIDIYVSNDYLVPNFLFINQGDGTFLDEIRERLDHCTHFSMGADLADINNDGLMDIAELDMMPEDHVLSKTYMRPMNAQLFFEVTSLGVIPQFMFNSLHVQHGFGLYSDIAQMAGVAKTDWSWAALLEDFDNDGWRDFLVTNGFRRNTKNNDFANQMLPRISEWVRNGQNDSVWVYLQDYPGYPLVNYLFKNNRDLTFRNVSAEWGFTEPSYSNGAAMADLDGDGDLDLVINNIDQPAFLYRNNTSEKTQRRWIRFALYQKPGQKAFNARVEIRRPNNEILAGELRTVRGYQSAVEPVVHFGLGDDPAIESIRVIWADGSVTNLKDLSVGKVHVVDKSKLGAVADKPGDLPDFLWRDFSATIFKEPFVHREDGYFDFAKEVLLPYRQSTLGPMLTVGDVNGDGWNDFFIGGAKGQSGRLYLMDPARGFYPGPCQPWEAQAGSEDMGGALADFDGDGDLDLYISSGGGGEFAQDDPALRDRLYLNTGNGCFTGPVQGAVPDIRGSSGRVAVGDWDGDGDPDLFVGGRTRPGQYPFPGRSALLRNNEGKFEEVTGAGLEDIGMVTDARFMDLNGDQQLDLLLCGEWMTLKAYVQEGGQFVDQTEAYGFANHFGWWYSMELADVDSDGDMDIIAGNIGLNNKFKIKDSHPLHVYATDFDDNGTTDIVLSSAYKGELVPVRGRQCSSDQMPFIKEKFPTYSGFANAKLVDVYGEEKLNEALHYQVNEARSMVWLNEGSSFRPLSLPNAAQMGPILSIKVLDANQDKIPDLIVGGDHSDTEPETPAYDGGKGMLLLGKGDGSFEALWFKDSGFYFTGKNVRDLALLPAGRTGGQLLLVASNDSGLQALLFGGPVVQ